MDRSPITQLVRLLLLVAVSAAVVAISFIQQQPDDQIHLVFCDVGQGDAILLIDGETQLLVDGGRGDRALDCLDEFLPVWDRTLELVVATHADADHIGGLTPVLEGYSVESFMIAPYLKDTREVNALVDALESEKALGMKVISPHVGRSISLNDRVRLTVLAPEVESALMSSENNPSPETRLWDKMGDFQTIIDSEIDHNDRSIVLFAELGDVSVLLTGDLEKKGEIALMERGLIPDVDVLKIAHHGSKSGTTSAFLLISQPEHSVISLGENNQYGHPDPGVEERLSAVGSQIWRTDQLGAIHVVSDGRQYWFAQ